MSQFYIFRNGASEGPYTEARLQELSQEGSLLPDSLVSRPGDSDWVTLREILPNLAMPPIPQTTNVYAPPAVPAQRENAQPFILNGKIVPGTEGLTARDVVELVGQGGRFVTFTYAFSIVVMSFRRSSGIYFLRPGQDGLSKAIGYSLLTGLVGWWGLPWGILFTIQSIFRNACGGVDVTEPILSAMVGPQAADQIVRQRGPVAKGMVMLSGLAILIAPILIYFIGSNAEPSRPKRPVPHYNR